MEPILDETSLEPCSVRPPAVRIQELALTMKALDEIGRPRVLRSVRDAVDRDIGDGLGLRTWCFDRATPKDAGRLVASRLAAQPFIDGPDGLFAAAEGRRAIEAKVNGTVVIGVGLAALTDGLVVLLASEARPRVEHLDVAITYIDDDGQRTEFVKVRAFANALEIEEARNELIQQVDRALRDGAAIVALINEIFPRLVLGARARDQIKSLTGNEPVFRQLVRHLRALDEGALQWVEGKPFEPVAITFSFDSKQTLDDGALGPLRDFPTPPGFEVERWSLHTKLTGGNGARLYFRAVWVGGRGLVLIGYFGDHLPTVKFRT